MLSITTPASCTRTPAVCLCRLIWRLFQTCSPTNWPIGEEAWSKPSVLSVNVFHPSVHAQRRGQKMCARSLIRDHFYSNNRVKTKARAVRVPRCVTHLLIGYQACVQSAFHQLIRKIRIPKNTPIHKHPSYKHHLTVFIQHSSTKEIRQCAGNLMITPAVVFLSGLEIKSRVLKYLKPE